MPALRPVLRSLAALFLAAAVTSPHAAEQRRYFVMFGAVFSADPAVAEVWADSPDFKLHKLRPIDRERKQLRYSKSPTEATIIFEGTVLSDNASEVPPLRPATIRWTLEGESVVYEATVPLQDYRSAHNFLHSYLLISVRPSGLLVELLANDENGLGQVFRCFGSSFSASGACKVRRTLHTLGTFAAHPTQLPTPSPHK